MMNNNEDLLNNIIFKEPKSIKIVVSIDGVDHTTYAQARRDSEIINIYELNLDHLKKWLIGNNLTDQIDYIEFVKEGG